MQLAFQIVCHEYEICAQLVQAELEARLDFDEELPPLDTAAFSQRIGTLGQQVQVCFPCTCTSAPQLLRAETVIVTTKHVIVLVLQRANQ